MADPIKIADDAPKLGASQGGGAEFNLLTNKIREQQHHQEQTAAVLAQLEEFAQDMLETQESEGDEEAGKAVTKSASKKVQRESEGSSSGQGASEDESTEETSSGTPYGLHKLGGSDFYINNNIPFQMFVDMMQERLKQLNAQSETQQMISLAYAGKNKSVDSDGKVTFSDQDGGGIVNMLCTTIMDSANQDSLKTLLAGTQSLSSAGASIGGAFTMAMGNTNKEDAEVDRLSNALDAEKEIPVNNSLRGGAATGATGYGGKDPEAMEDAISGLQDGTLTGELRLGSVKKVKSGITGKKVSYEAADRSPESKKAYAAQAENLKDEHAREYIVDNNRKNKPGEPITDAKKVTAEEALEKANPTERRAIRKKMKEELDRAKDALKSKQDQIQSKKQGIQNALKAFGDAGAAGMKLSEASVDAEKGRQQALKQSDETVQGTLNKIADTQGKSVDSRKNAIDQANQDLQKIISTVGQRG